MITVASFYHFTPFSDFRAWRAPLLQLGRHLQLKGSVLIASEGMNATVSGDGKAVDAFIAHVASDCRFNNMSVKKSYTDAHPFLRMKVKLKKEIVTLGLKSIDPRKIVGNYVEPSEWNNLVEQNDVLLIDSRNRYECDIGTFKGALNPRINAFRQFPTFLSEQVKPLLKKKKYNKIAMFCTGGIRCEKATSLARQMDIAPVYHLRGGILNYLAKVSPDKSLWQGECFVFDNRVAVNSKLEKGSYEQCHACRHPLSKADVHSQLYQNGVQCPHCAGKQSEKNRQRAHERHHQMALAKSRNEEHLAADIATLRAQKKQQQHSIPYNT